MGEAKPFETRQFRRRMGRLSVFATGMMAEGMGLTSNLLHFKSLKFSMFKSRQSSVCAST